MKTTYKILLSIFLAILFLSFLSLFADKIYEKESTHSVYNAGQDGHRKVYELLQKEGYNMKIEASDSKNIAYAGSGALWVIFPQETKYSKDEMEKIKDFVSRGGMLFIADRFGGARDAAKEFGIGIFNHTLVEYDSYAKRQDLPVLPAALGGGKIYSLAFKFPSAISAYPDGSEIISKSSRVSFIDSDDNGKITVKDQAGPFPVAVKVKVKDGFVVYFSDSSAFTNDLISRKDNEEFFKDFAFSLNPNIIIFDESHNENKILAKNINFFILVSDLLKNNKVYIVLFFLVAALFLIRQIVLKIKGKDKNLNSKYSVRPTEYSNVAKKILSNCGNNNYTRRWVVLTGYNKIKENIFAKTGQFVKNASKEYLLDKSGLNGSERNNLAVVIDLGMSLERGGKEDMGLNRMQEIIQEIERINKLLK